MGAEGPVERAPGSLRDPAGAVVFMDGQVTRVVRKSHAVHYDRLMSTGLYDALVSAGLLVSHVDVPVPAGLGDGIHRALRPQAIPFISYPYEWCFSQLKDAALVTLRAQEIAVRHGMTMKDASAYNVQFLNGRPVLIDTLSFEALEAGQPWLAYRQFCQHFLGPLWLMSKRDPRFGQASRAFLDGFPLDMVSRTLPGRAFLRPGLATHIRLHAALQSRDSAGSPARPGKTRLSRSGMIGLIDSLIGTVSSLKLASPRGGWSSYYGGDSYSAEALESKERAVEALLQRARPELVWDFGANTGRFSRIAARGGSRVIAFDSDHGATEIDYLHCKEENQTHILPLVQDLTNPSAPNGWASSERMGLIERGPADLVLALALIHHLAIGSGVPLEVVASFFRRVGRWLIVEFVPPDDPRAVLLMSTRKSDFSRYNEQEFRSAFESVMTIEQRVPIQGTARVLYLMRARG
jgi:SAM-dependent methyltransferase